MLLTAQLRNQDPLSPLDSTQFVEQLASFSAVEQQIETNNKLEALADSIAGGKIEEATHWIGKDVEVKTGAARFQGEPLDFIIPESASGTSSEVLIADAAGNVVFQERADNTRRSFSWNGESSQGGVVANGDYTVSVTTFDGEDIVDISAPIAIAAVREARFEESGLTLVLSNGVYASPKDIAALHSGSLSDETQ